MWNIKTQIEDERMVKYENGKSKKTGMVTLIKQSRLQGKAFLQIKGDIS